MEQLPFPENNCKNNSKIENDEHKADELLYKFEYSMILSAVGDALGWPVEFRKKPLKENYQGFIKWKKRIGGKWFGYEIEILPGEYSDDTQLMLSVSRSINENGYFEPIRFAYLELPLWLDYERGGGQSIKLAARNLQKENTDWFRNFYKNDKVDYVKSGANGAAMRNLPIALVNIENEKRFLTDTIKNTIITHGHPTALIGSVIIGAAQIYLFKNNVKKENFLRRYEEIIGYTFDLIKKTQQYLEKPEDEIISKWVTDIDKEKNYFPLFNEMRQEAENIINEMRNYFNKEDDDYYKFIKAFDPDYKSSGIATTCASLYLFLKYVEKPYEGLIKAANLIGSDTDTIGSFIGSLIGANFGKELDQRLLDLSSQIQDKEYIENVAKILFNIYKSQKYITENLEVINKKQAKIKIKDWNETFSKLIKEALITDITNKELKHPIFGNGKVIQYKKSPLSQKPDFVSVIIKVKFEEGQTCYFHAREKISNSNDYKEQQLI
ncbi:MAG: ADP-ribosylglycohydrolase family protein [Nitrososphaerota archaeon]